MGARASAFRENLLQHSNTHTKKHTKNLIYIFSFPEYSDALTLPLKKRKNT